MASEQSINSEIENKPQSVPVTCEQTEDPASVSVIPKTDHKGEAETRADLGAPSAGFGGSFGQESHRKFREEDENERADREFSETIEKLDSVLLEAGGKEGQVEGEAGVQVTPGGDTAVHKQALVTIVQVSAGETTVQEPADETTVQVTDGELVEPLQESTAQVTSDETSLQAPAEETTAQVTVGETSLQVPAKDTTAQVTVGETSLQAPAEETTAQVTVGETSLQVPTKETTAQVTVGEKSLQVPTKETTAQVTIGETSLQVPAEVTDEELVEPLRESTAQVTSDETSLQAPSEETIAQVTVGETSLQAPAEETTAQVTVGETTLQAPTEETTAQVTAGETSLQAPAEETPVHIAGDDTTVRKPTLVTIVQVSEEATTVQALAEETTAQVTEGELVEPLRESTAQVTSDETSLQAPAEETTAQVTELAEPMVKSTAQVTSDETTVHVSDLEASEPTVQVEVGPLVTVEDFSPQPVEGLTGTGVQVTKAGEAWIDTLVKNIVTEVTADEISAAEQTEEEGGHSFAGTTTIGSREQVTGAAQVSDDITVHEGEVTGPLEQPGVTGTPEQVGPPALEGVTEKEAAAEVEAGSPAKVTPDLATVPSREGTPDPGQPAACWEKEWPPLICTGSEVRADTAEPTHTEQRTVPEQEPPGAPDMKDREVAEERVVLAPETPIEREIRLAMEREMVLRQERGIKVTVGEPELVEVRRKMVAVEPAGPVGKERQLAGAQMQREIQLETQREQDLVEQGKVMGTYDRGPQQELQEKKMIFESMKTESSDPPFKRRQSEIQKSESTEALVEVPAPSNHVAPAAPAADVRKGPSYAEANGSNIIIIEHASILRKSTPGNVYNAAPADLRRTSPAESRRSTPADLRYSRSSSGNSTVPNSESPVAAPGSPFQVLRSPSPRSLLEREIEEVQERERELRRQRTSIYGRDNGSTENSQTTPNNQSDIQSGVYQPERPNWGKLEVNWPPNKSATFNGQEDQALDSPRTRRQRIALIESWESGNPNPDNN